MQQLTRSLNENRMSIETVLIHCEDVSYRHFSLGQQDQQAILIFITELIKKDLLDATILRECMASTRCLHHIDIALLKNSYISSSDLVERTHLEEIIDDLLAGNVILILDGDASALSMQALGWEHRGVEKSENEVSIRGSQQAFTENLSNNIALLRRFIRHPALKVEKHTIGEMTKTPYVILYLANLIQPELLEKIHQNLNSSQLDNVLDSGNLVEPLRKGVVSPFPIVNRTERPDRAAALMLEGRVIILVDNSPVALSMPSLFVEYLQVPEDYFENFYLQSMIRLLRYVALILAITIPSLYVSLVGYHHELIPSSMLPSIMSQRKGIPLPTFVEVLIMEILFEILREAGLRLPRPIGQTISIVGALVIGQAAVSAKLVMATTVIVVATTGIASFTIPGYGLSSAVRIIRFFLLLLTGLLGLFGFCIGMFFIFMHLVSLESYGIPYTGALSPMVPADLKDTLFRTPGQNQTHIPWSTSRGGKKP
nr:spore germination protein [Bacilli bacterium]